MISFRKDLNLWWPDYDPNGDGMLRRKLTDATCAARFCLSHSVAVQAGGHVGLWPLSLAKQFGRVFTFEPDPDCYQAMLRNVADAGATNIVMSDRALGPVNGPIGLSPRATSGSFRVQEDGTIPIEQITLDSLELPACDALFLDVEHYEVEALRGAALTIEKYSPVIHVEELPGVREAIQGHLSRLGYYQVFKVHGDRIYQRGKR